LKNNFISAISALEISKCINQFWKAFIVAFCERSEQKKAKAKIADFI
jgi:hypothetical protein